MMSAVSAAWQTLLNSKTQSTRGLLREDLDLLYQALKSVQNNSIRGPFGLKKEDPQQKKIIQKVSHLPQIQFGILLPKYTYLGDKTALCIVPPSIVIVQVFQSWSRNTNSIGLCNRLNRGLFRYFEKSGLQEGDGVLGKVLKNYAVYVPRKSHQEMYPCFFIHLPHLVVG